jgi:hypothetical protein
VGELHSSAGLVAVTVTVVDDNTLAWLTAAAEGLALVLAN